MDKDTYPIKLTRVNKCMICGSDLSRIAKLETALREARKGLADNNNHWHHPDEEPGACTACKSLAVVDAALEEK